MGQEHITATLANSLKSGSISHAYLLTGPRGVGKTSIARILAHEVNGLPYDETATHLDIIEIDAASNRRIDEIRELRERVHTSPTSAKYKVYIIDEVHMLTKEAFNALLKTLEEPPAHVIFILATTEAHKLPETIVSRTQRYTFKPIDQAKAVGHLRTIANTEGIKVDDEALELIATHGGGSFRDSISLLDQARNQPGQVTSDDVQRMLGIAPDEAISELLSILQSGDTKQLLESLSNFRQQGYHAAGLAKQLSRQLRNSLVAGNHQIPATKATKLLTDLINVPASHDAEALLEIILLDAVIDDQPHTAAQTSTPDIQPEKKPAPVKPAPIEDVKPVPKVTEPLPVAAESAEPQTAELNEDSWYQALQAIKKKHNTLYSVARMAVPSFGEDKLTLAFSFPFHQKRLSEAKNTQVIADTLKELTGKSIKIECVTDKHAVKQPSVSKPEVKKAANNPQLETISNIFGDAEVLE